MVNRCREFDCINLMEFGDVVFIHPILAISKVKMHVVFNYTNVAEIEPINNKDQVIN